jgi:hypothetical protein
MTYLANRWGENSTRIWGGIALFCALLVGLIIWHYRALIVPAVVPFFVGLWGTFRAAISDEFARHLKSRLRLFSQSTLLTEEHEIMSAVNSPEASLAGQLLGDAPDFVSGGLAAIKVINAFRSGGFTAAGQTLAENGAALDKVLADIKSLGVKEAIAAGVVVQAPH